MSLTLLRYMDSLRPCYSQEAQSLTLPSNIRSLLNELQLDQIKASTTLATVQGNKGILYLIVQAY